MEIIGANSGLGKPGQEPIDPKLLDEQKRMFEDATKLAEAISSTGTKLWVVMLLRESKGRPEIFMNDINANQLIVEHLLSAPEVMRNVLQQIQERTKMQPNRVVFTQGI